MDLRVLIGVFVTLFGIAVGMAGGDIQSQDLMETLQNGDYSTDLSSEGIGFGSGLTLVTDLLSFESSKPANTTVQANLSSGEGLDIKVKSPSTLVLHITPGSNIHAGDGTFTAQATEEGPSVITFDGFKGTVKTGDNITVDGTMRSINMAIMSLNYSRSKKVRASSGIQKVHLSGLKDQHVSFNDAQGTITTGALREANVDGQTSFRYFRGSLNFSPNDDGFDYMFDGKVHKGTLSRDGSQVTIGGTN